MLKESGSAAALPVELTAPVRIGSANSPPIRSLHLSELRALSLRAHVKSAVEVAGYPWVLCRVHVGESSRKNVGVTRSCENWNGSC